LPFEVDTNRLSDGVSSISPLGATAPSFPLYNGSLEAGAVGGRAAAAAATDANRALQGVAPRGAGAAEREAAVVALLEQYGDASFNFSEALLGPAPNRTFPVHAGRTWNPSQFPIQEGESYTIQVEHDACYWVDDGIKVDADGYPSFYDAFSRCYVAAGKCRPHLRQARRLPSANWMALVCGVGNYNTKLQEVASGLGHYMPVREDDLIPTYFAVGAAGAAFEARHTGELICFANDGHGLYHNNEGALNVTVTRASWPPASDLRHRRQQAEVRAAWQAFQDLGADGGG